MFDLHKSHFMKISLELSESFNTHMLLKVHCTCKVDCQKYSGDIQEQPMRYLSISMRILTTEC